ncbi:DNAase [Candidatus Gracilibacteria bacterium CG17_big_fil_post_rev_8_21_14_2_50_48_13]|nr:MAG: DNAase [Candidatus Gracilibacteria bacterium CG17_big_fil_post_rev_8_21_14_2_50_48_13]
MFIDTHAHLTFPDIASNSDVLGNCTKHGVSHVISIACSPDTHSEDLNKIQEVAQASTSPKIYAAIGVHPDHFDNPEAEDFLHDIERLRVELLANIHTYADCIVALGECGLDFYRTYHKEAQEALFRMQIDLATERKLPLIIHTRDAWDDTFRILSDYPDLPFVLHCFTGSPKEAATVLTWKNSMISLSGIVSFKNAHDVHESAAYIPLDRLLIETDSPYLAPVPHRGETNQPAFVSHVADAIASLRQTTPEAIGDATSQNARRFFSLA